MAVPWPFLPFVLPLVLPASRSLPTFFSLATFDLSVDLRDDFGDAFVGGFLVTLGMGAYFPCPARRGKVLRARISAKSLRRSTISPPPPRRPDWAWTDWEAL